MRKALILGIGGTGGHAINRVRDLIEWRQNKHVENMPNIQYLELDADRSVMPESGEMSVILFSCKNKRSSLVSPARYEISTILFFPIFRRLRLSD